VAGHVARITKTKNRYRILVGKLKEIAHLENLGVGERGNVKLEFQEPQFSSGNERLRVVFKKCG
jgi:hypothetical protein